MKKDFCICIKLLIIPALVCSNHVTLRPPTPHETYPIWIGTQYYYSIIGA